LTKTSSKTSDTDILAAKQKLSMFLSSIYDIKFVYTNGGLYVYVVSKFNVS
jgi:hypothetical protein